MEDLRASAMLTGKLASASRGSSRWRVALSGHTHGIVIVSRLHEVRSPLTRNYHDNAPWVRDRNTLYFR